MSALDEIQEGHNEYAAKANGLLNKIEDFDTFIGLKLSFLMFAQLSSVPQTYRQLISLCKRQ